MSAARPPPSKQFDLHITVVSAKHLKNVNWRHGDLKPYIVLWVDADRRLSTKSDNSGSTKPVWNENFVVPVTVPLQEALLTLEIFHSKPSETPKPLIGTLRIVLNELVDPDDSSLLRKFDLHRPSGRPHGKIRMKIALRERPPPPPPVHDYHITPPQSYYYASAPPPLPVRDYRGYSAAPFTTPLQPPSSPMAPPPTSQPHQFSYGGYDPYSGYYPGYYAQPPPPPRPFFERQSSYGGPSAPVDYTPPYDPKQKIGKVDSYGAGLGVGAVAGGIAGLSLDEGLKHHHEEDKIGERSESDFTTTNTREDYSDYRFSHDYHK